MSTTLLPPTARDFEIHRLCLVEFLSTRRIAEKFEISQTRVRQILARVSSWLAQTLPLATEADQEREKRLATHLAAAQLQHQIEQLQIFWSATSDPKYLRQQTRAILALARLGIAPGALDALAADAETSTDHATRRTADSPPAAGGADSPSAQPWTLDFGPWTSPAQLRAPHSALPDAPPPPSEDCSPQPFSASPTDPAAPPLAAATTSQPTEFAESATAHDDELTGLNLLEQRLLTLLGNTPEDDVQRRQSLDETLTKVRQQKASYVLELSPRSPGAITHTCESFPAPPDPRLPTTDHSPLTHSPLTPTMQ